MTLAEAAARYAGAQFRHRNATQELENLRRQASEWVEEVAVARREMEKAEQELLKVAGGK